MVILVTGITLTITNSGKVGRDGDELHDVHIIGEHIGENKTIGVPNEVYNNWSFQFYLLRYYNISMKAGEKNTLYYLSNKSSNIKLNSNFKRQKIKLRQHQLFKK